MSRRDGRWRSMTVADLPRIGAIAAEVHPAYPEDDAIPAERLRLYPAGCLALEHDGSVEAYVVSHPWRALAPPKLNTLLGALPSPATTYYVHDLALLPAVRGEGHAAAAVDLLVREARRARLLSMSLIAVNGSVPFWSGQGFTVVQDTVLADVLTAYDSEAAYMVRNLPGWA